MDNENEQAQEVVEEQEETTQEEVESTETDSDTGSDESGDDDVEEEETVTLKKSDFTKLNRKARAYDSTKEKPKTEIITKSVKTEPSSERQDRIELRLDGYTKEEVDEIMDLGGPKVLESKIVQSAIETMRAKKKSKEATADFSAKSPVYKKHTMDDLKGMTSAELEKILPHA